MARLVFFEKSPGAGSSKRYKIRKTKGWRNVRLISEPTSRKLWEEPDVVVAFNMPRISAALERLMGTNIVRLTDRNYIKQLHARIEDDYRQNLLKRIKARELKEIERERNLIVQGKTKEIPNELADDPCFVVSQKADMEIAKSRANLVTNRERNAELMKSLGAKWERERQIFEGQEAQKLEELTKRFNEQKQLERQYIEEDATKGMDLLRIDNEEWRECELNLKEFLQEQRDKMKERSERKPTPFTSDAKDLQNILRTRKECNQSKTGKYLNDKQSPRPKNYQAQSSILASMTEDNGLTSNIDIDEPETLSSSRDQKSLVQKNLSTDEISDISSGESFGESSTISMAKKRYATMLKQELESDVAQGLLISKDQYDHLRYDDAKVKQLRTTKDLQELFQLAEEIIKGDPIVVVEEDDHAEDDEVADVTNTEVLQ
ncbi:uncharacterized protein LOC142238798 [Haematobia irritans]|uniref:uncharacterized protein LOC142238798 n=1 Tax=Haematobia irritans TaxID=7368 RepID=UPI003F50495D